jgi:hypothetical protein
MMGFPAFTGVDWGLLYPDAEVSGRVIAVLFGFLFRLYLFTCNTFGHQVACRGISLKFVSLS